MKDNERSVIGIICFTLLFMFLVFACMLCTGLLNTEIARLVYHGKPPQYINNLIQGTPLFISAIISVGIYGGLHNVSLKDSIKDNGTKKAVLHGLGIGVLLYISVTFFMSFFPLTETAGNVKTLQGFTPWVWVLTAVVLAPIGEELIFRYLVVNLMDGVPKPIIYIFSAVPFGLLHYSTTSTGMVQWQVIAVPMICGIIFMAMYYKHNRNIMSAIITHSTYNLCNTIPLLISMYLIK